MIKRFLEERLKELSLQYPIVALTGPRQSGKTTLAKLVFPDYQYVSLEDPDNREFAENDPRGFLNKYSIKVVLDEIQRVPSLFSYLQTAVDENPSNGRFILTGSQQFLLNEKISQSLAGRTTLLCLLSFSLAELNKRQQQQFWQNNNVNQVSAPLEKNVFEVIHAGFYPRIHDRNLEPQQWYRDYFETYVTKDVKNLLNIGDSKTFEQFLRLLAGRSGQLLNLTSLGNDSGVSHTTARRWISILEASYIIKLLQPHFNNFNKRMIKAPKIYFLDSGLLCYLLRIASAKNLATHPLLGGIFETFIIGEIMKWYTHQGKEAPLYFWRDRSGDEIDLVIDRGERLYPVEIKASQTISAGLFKNLKTWLALKGNKQTSGALVYGGNDFQTRENIQIIPWYAVS
jgi:predicted AAA+ superfamily ATPase